MPPKDILWPLEPHTVGKHRVLRNYMQAWLPIMSRWNGQVVFIDGFAGPGEYDRGEPGSPVIALRTLIDHQSRRRFACKFYYVFIEKDKRRCNHLSNLLTNMHAEIPENCNYEIINSAFDETLTVVLDKLDEQNSQSAPSFIMIDPFGVSDTPMPVIARILANLKAEVYISLMYEFINRFDKKVEHEARLDKLFGYDSWRIGRNITNYEEKKQFYLELYERQLKAAGAEYVLRFELYEGGRMVYAIFFGTHSLDGCDKMKQAIWKEAPLGDYKFKGDLINQLSLGDDILDIASFRKSLINEFGSRGWVTIEEVTNFAKSDRTGFHSGHLKAKTLTPMEREGAIEVEPSSRKSKRGYPQGTKLRFRHSQLSGRERADIQGCPRSASQPTLFGDEPEL